MDPFDLFPQPLNMIQPVRHISSVAIKRGRTLEVRNQLRGIDGSIKRVACTGYSTGNLWDAHTARSAFLSTVV